ncbi:hypothetical protein BDV95DRAFT_308540 [Massariosphaeria phaeospora]|uniref:Uncharacterized protein n=1 Tax=Massariosphaeria phaeospora TaxID=100035 RepID=A0A7C8IB61_9PLEO|nr:hypothetical protein BDV95DRAFT_308540 [Massariosphaeria phaeospora]
MLPHQTTTHVNGGNDTQQLPSTSAMPPLSSQPPAPGTSLTHHQRQQSHHHPHYHPNLQHRIHTPQPVPHKRNNRLRRHAAKAEPPKHTALHAKQPHIANPLVQTHARRLWRQQLGVSDMSQTVAWRSGDGQAEAVAFGAGGRGRGVVEEGTADGGRVRDVPGCVDEE